MDAEWLAATSLLWEVRWWLRVAGSADGERLPGLQTLHCLPQGAPWLGDKGCWQGAVPLPVGLRSVLGDTLRTPYFPWQGLALCLKLSAGAAQALTLVTWGAGARMLRTLGFAFWGLKAGLLFREGENSPTFSYKPCVTCRSHFSR